MIIEQQDERWSNEVREAMVRGPDGVFVFGSNLAGIHGAGAAFYAKQQFGAVMGHGDGWSGNRCYAIPTKNEYFDVLPLHIIEQKAQQFLLVVENNPYREFWMTRVGCGLAGYTNEAIAPLFFTKLVNLHLPPQWEALR